MLASGADMQKSHKPLVLRFRIVGISEHIPESSFSPNRDVLAVRILDAQEGSKPAKMVYRYLGYEHRWPVELLDSDLVHTFKAVRDRSCDETWHMLTTKFELTSSGKVVMSSSMTYLDSGQPPTVEPNDVLRCYVIQPRGYRGSQQEAEATLPSSGLGSK
jgi:hypothetical protein